MGGWASKPFPTRREEGEREGMNYTKEGENWKHTNTPKDRPGLTLHLTYQMLTSGHFCFIVFLTLELKFIVSPSPSLLLQNNCCPELGINIATHEKYMVLNLI